MRLKRFSFSAYSKNVQYPLLSDRIAQQQNHYQQGNLGLLVLPARLRNI